MKYGDVIKVSYGGAEITALVLFAADRMKEGVTIVSDEGTYIDRDYHGRLMVLNLSDSNPRRASAAGYHVVGKTSTTEQYEVLEP